MAANEVIIVAKGNGEDLASIGVEVDDRIAISAVVAPVAVDCEQMLLIHSDDVLGVVCDYTPVDKVRPL